MLCNSYYFLGKILGFDIFIDAYLSIFLSARNGVFVGFLFTSMGCCLAAFKNRITDISVMTLVIAYFLYFAEIWTVFYLSGGNLGDDGSLFLSHMVFIPLLVSYASSHSLKISKKLSHVCRYESDVLYFFHRFVFALIWTLEYLCNISFSGLNVLNFILVFIICSFIGIVWIYIKNVKIGFNERKV